MSDRRPLDAAYFRDMGYPFARQLPSGEWLGIRQMFYTWGLFRGLDETGYSSRFCYESAADAIVALANWDGEADPPGMWIKHKGARGGDRLNPAWLEATRWEIGGKP